MNEYGLNEINLNRFTTNSSRQRGNSQKFFLIMSKCSKSGKQDTEICIYFGFLLSYKIFLYSKQSYSSHPQNMSPPSNMFVAKDILEIPIAKFVLNILQIKLIFVHDKILPRLAEVSFNLHFSSHPLTRRSINLDQKLVLKLNFYRDGR